MINVEDLRIGDIVQTNKDCMFPKGTLCLVTEIHPDRQHNDKKGVVSLKAVNDEDDGPWGHGAATSMACPLRPKYLKRTVLKKRSLANILQSLLITRSIFCERFGSRAEMW